VTLQAVVFDFDGTIFDTETTTYDAVVDVYAAHKRPLDQHWWSTMIGTTTDATDAALERLADECGLDVNFIAIEVRARVRELLRNARPRPGVEALVEECRSMGIPLAVATSAPRKWVAHHLTNLGMLELFSALVPVDEVRYAKPHPEPYLTACRLLQAEPRQSVAIEDSPPGVRSAVSAGLFTLGVASHLTRGLDLSLADQEHDSLEGVCLADLQAAVAARG
jgi:HAD superfamily hydrolase (TIGR01509 family)